jgi:glutathione S-transferase
MYRLFGDPISGNCYKVALTLAQTDREFEWAPISVTSGETKKADFLARNPFGEVPVLQLPDGSYLSQSNAIISFLAEGTPLLPNDPLSRARVNEWLFWEQYSHEPVIATTRFWIHYLNAEAEYAERIAANRERGYAALAVMEQQLEKQDFLANNRYSVADIALYAYTHVCHQGGFSLSNYPAVRAWLARVAAQPAHLPMF